MTEKKTRRTQAERSAATRKLLLDAAIKCLFRHGYGATSTIMVAERAGVSRGAMLHQFPSKADLMTYVVEAVFENEVALYKKLLKGVENKRERLVAYPEAAWKVLSRPSGVAVLEILQGSRSDKALAAMLAPVQAKIDASARSLLKEEFGHVPSIGLLRLIVGAVRGLSVIQLLAQPGEDITEAVRVLQVLIRAGLETGAIPEETEHGGSAGRSRSGEQGTGRSPASGPATGRRR